MGKNTGVSWATASHGFWYGCEKVSQGCKHCYAERQMIHYGREFRMLTRSKNFDLPLRWKEPERIFVCPQSDFFIQKADDWRSMAWQIIKSTPRHTYLILTKRPERIEKCLPSDWADGYPNVWLGVSAESQIAAERRIPVLLSIPAALHWISVEPMLGPVDLRVYLHGAPRLGWVVVGGESGPHQQSPKTARPLDMAWARALRDQCVGTDTPFFFKQDSDVQSEQRPWIVETDGSFTTYQQLPTQADKPPDFTQQRLF
jgi:protein gp37